VYSARREAGFVMPSLLGRTDFRAVRAPSLQIEVAQIIIHKADQPDTVLHFFYADGLTGKDRC